MQPVQHPDLGPTEADCPAGSLLAFLSAGLLIVGTVLGVLAGMLWVLQVAEAETDRDDEPT